MQVHLTIERAAGRGVRGAEIARRARAMLRATGHANAELSIVLTGDDQIKKLNRSFRKKNKPTDVLSFAMREGEGGALAGALLGDVVISVPTAARQAKDKGHSVLAELTFLLAHGVLHLQGWDHRTDAEERAMDAETARLCALAAPARRPRRAGTTPRKRRA